MTTVFDIQRACAELYGVSKEELLGTAKLGRILRCRQVAMYLCRRNTSCSFPLLGRLFHRDHTSIMQAVTTIQRRRLQERELNDEIIYLTGVIAGEEHHRQSHGGRPLRAAGSSDIRNVASGPVGLASCVPFMAPDAGTDSRGAK